MQPRSFTRFSVSGRRVLRILSTIFEEISAELGGEDFASAMRFSLGRAEIKDHSRLTTHEQFTLAHRVLAAWYTILWFVTVPLFRQRARKVDDAAGYLRLVITQHPNTPRPAWWLLAMQNAGNYLDGAELLSDSELHHDLKTIIRELCTRPLRDKAPLDVVSNLEMVLKLYGARLWRRADQFHRMYGTWMVCDLDGQAPENVPPEKLRRGARILREYAIGQYLNELRSLAERVSRRFPDGGAESRRGIEQNINLINNALVATSRGLGAPNAFNEERDFLTRLGALRESLEPLDPQLAAEVSSLEAKARVFGFAFLDMFPRVNALSVRPLGEQLFQTANQKPLSASEPERCAELAASSPVVLSAELEHSLPKDLAWLLACLKVFAEIRKANGRPMPFVISNFEFVSDELLLDMLLKAVGLPDTQIIHLHEGFEPVVEAARLSRETVKRNPARWKAEPYVVMFGGSDMQRECGCSGQWELARAIQRTGNELRSEGVTPNFFYGRADTFFRWGSSLDEFRAAQPDTEPRCLVLVQGDDVIRRRLTYQQADMHRSHPWSPGLTPDPIFEEANAVRFDRSFRSAIERYKQLTASPDFERFFSEATPASWISSINRSVRPKSRSGGFGGVRTSVPKWGDWRAIVTIQAGMVSGYIPQLYGAGAALTGLVENDRELLREMWRESRWFRYWLGGVMRESQRVDFDTVTIRSDGRHESIVKTLRDDFVLCAEVIPEIVQQRWSRRFDRILPTNQVRRHVAHLEQKLATELAEGAIPEVLRSGYMAILASLGENG